MIDRIRSHTVTFARPFTLTDAGEQPAGTYTVETEEALLPTSTIAYRRIATWIRLPGPLGSAWTTEIVRLEPEELTRLLASDAAANAVWLTTPLIPIGQRKEIAPAAHQVRIKELCKNWFRNNTIDLAWTALTVGGVLISGLAASP